MEGEGNNGRPGGGGGDGPGECIIDMPIPGVAARPWGRPDPGGRVASPGAPPKTENSFDYSWLIG